MVPQDFVQVFSRSVLESMLEHLTRKKVYEQKRCGEGEGICKREIDSVCKRKRNPARITMQGNDLMADVLCDDKKADTSIAEVTARHVTQYKTAR